VHSKRSTKTSRAIPPAPISSISLDLRISSPDRSAVAYVYASCALQLVVLGRVILFLLNFRLLLDLPLPELLAA